MFLNKKTLEMLEKTIKNDQSDKIIIVQGDHGSKTLPQTNRVGNNEKWIQEEYSILNAIYISKEGKSKRFIYNNWNYSSVNTFRLIFNGYFGNDLPLLEDYKYFSKTVNPYIYNKIK